MHFLRLIVMTISVVLMTILVVLMTIPVVLMAIWSCLNGYMELS